MAGSLIGGAIGLVGGIIGGNKQSKAIDKASDAQEKALLKVYTGQAGGPIADLVKLIGEVVDVRRAPIGFDVVEGKGTVTIGDNMRADLEPFRGPTGQPTTLRESIFSTVPGSPAYVGKASSYRQQTPELNQDIDLKGHNAIRSDFRFYLQAAA